MNDDTNKTIAYNTLIMYVRLVLTTILSLFTTRFALQALGVVDYGLFSVLGSITTFIGIINTIMLSTSNRFIAVSIGKGNIEEANEQFNINLIIHIAIAIFTLFLAIPIGNWYIDHYVNFAGSIDVAKDVYNITIIGSIISFVIIPYNGLLMAKEKFIVFCSVDVISHLLKLGVALLLVSHFTNKLIIYSITLSFISSYPLLVYYAYCKMSFPEIVKWKFVSSINKYKEVFTFSSWISFGAIITVAKSQGSALLVNMFFNTVMNAALGIANTVNSLVTMFAHNISNPLVPQITKNYAAGNYHRSNSLLVMSTKWTFLAMLIISTPFLNNANWILGLWLGEVPPFATKFTILIIVDALITSFNSGISNLIFASGKLGLYQISVNLLRLLAIVVSYAVLKYGMPAYSILYVYIAFSVVNFFVVQIILHKTLNFDNSILFRGSYIPSLKVLFLSFPFFILSRYLHPLLSIVLLLFVQIVIIYNVALNGNEKQMLHSFISNLCKIKN